MNRKYSLIVYVIALVLLVSVGGANAQEPGSKSSQAALGTVFTYQGQLKDANGPINGNCDLQFSLWDSLTNLTGQIGATQSMPNVILSNGLFIVQLDFGTGSFMGDACWLEIAVRCPAGSGSYITLAPRHLLTPVPYAFALPGLWTQQNTTSPNVIGGYRDNTIAPGVYGAVIAGGGASEAVNDVSGNYATISGGRSNTAQGTAAVVGGGMFNNA